MNIDTTRLDLSGRKIRSIELAIDCKGLSGPKFRSIELAIDRKSIVEYVGDISQKYR